MSTTTRAAAVASRSGKVIHLAAGSGSTWTTTWCGRTIDAQGTTAEPTCAKCVRREAIHRLAGSAGGHFLSLTSPGENAANPDLVTATCSCSGWRDEEGRSDPFVTLTQRWHDHLMHVAAPAPARPDAATGGTPTDTEEPTP